MTKQLKFKVIFFLCVIFNSAVWGQILNNTQIIHSDHWIYDSLYKLGKETKTLGFYENTMISAGEIKFYFEKINRESLSSTIS